MVWVIARSSRKLEREIAALDRLAASREVKPLTAFGFAYDHFDQEVRWHAPAEGLGTAEALRQGLEAGRIHSPDVASDLEALASVLRVAVAQGVEFSLVLRLFEKDGAQEMSREERQGSFW